MKGDYLSKGCAFDVSLILRCICFYYDEWTSYSSNNKGMNIIYPFYKIHVYIYIHTYTICDTCSIVYLSHSKERRQEIEHKYFAISRTYLKVMIPLFWKILPIETAESIDI